MNLQPAQDILALHAARLQTGTPLPLNECTRPGDAAHGEDAGEGAGREVEGLQQERGVELGGRRRSIHTLIMCRHHAST